jgi:hypothetical protein
MRQICNVIFLGGTAGLKEKEYVARCSGCKAKTRRCVLGGVSNNVLDIIL